MAKFDKSFHEGKTEIMRRYLEAHNIPYTEISMAHMSMPSFTDFIIKWAELNPPEFADPNEVPGKSMQGVNEMKSEQVSGWVIRDRNGKYFSGFYGYRDDDYTFYEPIQLAYMFGTEESAQKQADNLDESGLTVEFKSYKIEVIM